MVIRRRGLFNMEIRFGELERMIKDGEPRNDVMVKLEEFLEDAGCKPLRESKSRRGNINRHYLSKDGKYVTTFIINAKGMREACIYDVDVFKEYFAEGGKVISLNGKDNNKNNNNNKNENKNVKWDPVLWFKDKITKMHRLVLGEAFVDWEPGGKEVDHIYHTHRCFIRETLRTCEGWQNRMNKPSKCVAGIGDSLEIAYDDFNYKPLQDFSETWYALILWKMLDIPYDDVVEYQRDYMVKNHPDRAGGCMLAS